MKNPINCREVWVVFKDRSRNGQRLSYTECDGANSLVVELRDGVLQVNYVFGTGSSSPQQPGGPGTAIVYIGSGKVLKSINYMASELLEYSCEQLLLLENV